MDKIQILIAAHKEGNFPTQSVFLPIHVGRQLSSNVIPIEGDDVGRNISSKNPTYAELTALYWAWKNLRCDVVGLMHYRRYFNFDRSLLLYPPVVEIDSNSTINYSVEESYINKVLDVYDVILPKQVHHPYSVEIEYNRCHAVEDLDIVTDIINRDYPGYSDAWSKYLKLNNRCSYYNMFIMKKDKFDAYCFWLFDILEKAENEIKLSPYAYQQRVLGFLGERLLSFYCFYHNFRVKRFPIYFVNNEKSRRDSPIACLTQRMRNDISFYISNIHAFKFFIRQISFKRLKR